MNHGNGFRQFPFEHTEINHIKKTMTKSYNDIQTKLKQSTGSINRKLGFFWKKNPNPQKFSIHTCKNFRIPRSQPDSKRLSVLQTRLLHYFLQIEHVQPLQCSDLVLFFPLNTKKLWNSVFRSHLAIRRGSNCEKRHQFMCTFNKFAKWILIKRK